MDYNSVVASVVQYANESSDKPFMVYRDKDNGWHCDYSQNKLGRNLSWVKSAKEQDPFAQTFVSQDFTKNSFAHIYDTVLSRCIYAEFEKATDDLIVTEGDYKRQRSLIEFVVAYACEFPKKVIEYLATIDRPYEAIREICTLNMTTYYRGFNFNEDLADRAIACIEEGVNNRLIANEYDPTQDVRSTEGYVEKAQIQLGGKNIMLLENPDAADRYLVSIIKRDNPLGIEERYDALFTNEYLDAMIEFTFHVDAITNQLMTERNESRLPTIKLTAEDCIQGGNNSDWKGKAIIVKPECLAPEYWSAEHQLVLCTGGFGANPGTLGNEVYVKELYSGKECQYDRHQIAGIAEISKMPKWAVNKLEEYIREQKPDISIPSNKHSGQKRSDTKTVASKKPLSLNERLKNAKETARQADANRNVQNLNTSRKKVLEVG